MKMMIGIGKPRDSKEIDPIDVHDGFHALMKAHEIKQNQPLMKKIAIHAQKQKAAIQSIANPIASISDLKKKRDEPFHTDPTSDLENENEQT